ncbi:MAG: hypothetical protein H6713_14290 [Myxococcales bacterium]|nr:hypothetical protein [Myxococcales bacterium]MCB9751143.1 hypothetical protein [Myxococcales bacterium]
MPVRRRHALAPALALALACGDDDAASSDATSDGAVAREWRTVLDHAAWRIAEAAEDPFADHRPPEDEIDCGVAGWLVESGALEVDTLRCNYLTLVQPVLEDLTPETPMRLEFRHFDLIAPAPATAHVAVQLGDAIIWEREIQIPGPAMVFSEDALTAGVMAPAGTPLYFHLHNHGQNTYTFASLEAELPVASP